jgi:hypothetical protein
LKNDISKCARLEKFNENFKKRINFIYNIIGVLERNIDKKKKKIHSK